MATAQQLSRTYSFIGPLLADPVLSAYGDNALPLFAVGLHLDVEDLASFATESLTEREKGCQVPFPLPFLPSHPIHHQSLGGRLTGSRRAELRDRGSRNAWRPRSFGLRQPR